MNGIKTAVLLASLSVVLMAIGGLVGGHNGVILMFLISLGINFFSYWNSDTMVLKMYNARPADPTANADLYDIVKTLAERGNIPMPKVYIVDADVPNAFATGRNPSHAAVAVTTGIMRLLNRDEIEGVLGHELTHVIHRDTLISTIAASIASAISMLANVLQWGLIFGGARRDEEEGGGNPLAILAVVIIAPLVAAVLQMAISRSREYMADAGGAKLSHKPLALASALIKIEEYAKYGTIPVGNEGEAKSTAHMFIVNPFSMVPSMRTLFSTHPSTESRVERLEAIAAQMEGK